MRAISDIEDVSKPGAVAWLGGKLVLLEDRHVQRVEARGQVNMLKPAGLFPLRVVSWLTEWLHFQSFWVEFNSLPYTEQNVFEPCHCHQNNHNTTFVQLVPLYESWRISASLWTSQSFYKVTKWYTGPIAISMVWESIAVRNAFKCAFEICAQSYNLD